MDCFIVYETVVFERCDFLLQSFQSRRPFCHEFRIVAVLPTSKHVRDVILWHALALIVQRVAVVLHVVKPDSVGLAALCENENGRRYTGIGAENTGWH